MSPSIFKFKRIYVYPIIIVLTILSFSYFISRLFFLIICKAIFFLIIWYVIRAILQLVVPDKESIKDFVLLTTSILVILFLAEVTLSIDGTHLTYTEKNGNGYVSPYSSDWNKTWYHVLPPYYKIDFERKEFPTIWTANNEGLKDKDFVIAKNKKRIMMLGDSFTEGVGASNDSSLPRQLDYLLADAFSGKTEVWNCGVSSSDPVYEFRLFKDKLLKYNPDIVVVVINPSDVHDVIIRGGFERFGSDGKVAYRSAPWFEPLFAHSQIVRRIVLDVYRYDWDFIQPRDTAITNHNAYAILENTLDSFVSVCEPRKIKLIFAFHPALGEIRNITPYIVSPLITYCERKDYQFVDIKKQLNLMGIDSSNAQALFWKEDMHCNNRGYYYFARSIYKKVIEILDDSTS